MLNRAFDFSSYLDQMMLEGSRLTRLFVLSRELQTAMNPYSTGKPETIDYVAPTAASDLKRQWTG